MFDKSKVQIGDILLYVPLADTIDHAIIGKIITTFSYGGKYAHAAIYSGYGNIIESHMDSGVVEKQLSEKWYSKIDVYRYLPGLTTEQKHALINYLRDKELGKRYDLAAFPSSFYKATLAKVFGWKNFSKAPSLLNDDAHRFCSELVAVGYYEALKLELVSDLDPKAAQPANLGKSKLLKRIS